jgi:hypothetical protein
MVEMKAFITTKEDQHYEHTMTRKNCEHIINAAYALENSLEKLGKNNAYPQQTYRRRTTWPRIW